jgi:hypothetical protein
MKTEFTEDELNNIFSLARKIEDLLNDQDFETAFNALLLNIAGGGRQSSVSRDDYTHMVVNNLDNWWDHQIELDMEQRETELKNALFVEVERRALLAQFKQTDWHYQRAEGNGYYEGRESYEKTMRMVNAMGDEGLKLMEVYLAESGIKL